MDMQKRQTYVVWAPVMCFDMPLLQLVYLGRCMLGNRDDAERFKRLREL